MKKVIYGGTFSPPHDGHKASYDWLVSQGHSVIVVPSIGHEFKPETVVTYLHRREMANLVFGSSIKPIEEEILKYKPLPIRAIDMLEFVYSCGYDYVDFAIGPDVDVLSWSGADKILSSSSFGFISIPHSDHLRSTDIRKLITENQPWEHLVHPKVAGYIKLHGLYTNP